MRAMLGVGQSEPFLMPDFGVPKIAAFGEASVVLALQARPSLEMQLALGHAARGLEGAPGVVDAVAGVGNLTVFYDPEILSFDAASDCLRAAWNSARIDTDEGPSIVTIPVKYGGENGPDLIDIARARGMEPDDVIARHACGTYVVYVMGFSPGFAYLGGLDPLLHTPRRDRPRTRVPAGSVAIGGAMTGVYPQASPGGWNIIGRTDCALFDARRAPPALLTAGSQVRFVAV